MNLINKPLHAQSDLLLVCPLLSPSPITFVNVLFLLLPPNAGNNPPKLPPLNALIPLKLNKLFLSLASASLNPNPANGPT
jgi:hypothetical protein